MIIVSACLLGLKCRYDGKACRNPDLVEGLPPDAILPVCPEQMGGLSTPREPASLIQGDGDAVLDGNARVMTRSGKEVTKNYLAGTEAVLAVIALKGGIEKAVLKDKSPSCGLFRTYIDGTLTPGKGVLAAALARAGIPILSDATP